MDQKKILARGREESVEKELSENWASISDAHGGYQDTQRRAEKSVGARQSLRETRPGENGPFATATSGKRDGGKKIENLEVDTSDNGKIMVFNIMDRSWTAKESATDLSGNNEPYVSSRVQNTSLTQDRRAYLSMPLTSNHGVDVATGKGHVERKERINATFANMGAWILVDYPYQLEGQRLATEPLSPSSLDALSLYDHEASPRSTVGTASSPPENIFACKVDNCGAMFTGIHARGNLVRHVKTRHNRTAQKEFLCRDPACDRIYKRSDARLMHESRAHPQLAKIPALSRMRKSRSDAGGV